MADGERIRRTSAVARLPGYRYGFAIVAVAVATTLFLPGRDLFAKGQWGLLYLLVTAVVAYFTDARGAVAAALLSFLAWNYFFLPPYGHFALEDPKDLVTLVVFLAIAVVLGLRTAGLRRSEAAALAREREARELGGLASALLSAGTGQEMTGLVFDVVDRLFDPREVALVTLGDNGVLTAARRRGSSDVRSAVEDAMSGGLPADGTPCALPGSAAGGVLEPLRSGDTPAGALYVGPAGTRFEERDSVGLVRSIAAMAATFSEQTRLRDTLARAQAEREADRLRGAIVSSVSHELKTPLASATAAVTGLLLDDAADDGGRVRTELTAVTSDLARLEVSIADLLDVSRLESRSWRASLERYAPGEIIGQALDGLATDRADRIVLDVPEGLPDVLVDLRQMARALRNVIDNALNYAPGGAVVIAASESGSAVRLTVTDTGPGVAEQERVVVFDKLYRGRGAAPGTGMGLAIAKEVVALHGGRIWIEDAVPHGARVVIELPVATP